MVTRDEIYELYVEEGLSSIAIAEKLGVSARYILKLLKKWDIPRRTKSEALKRAYADGRRKKRCHPNQPTKEKLEELYVKKRLTQAEIARILSCNRRTVYAWLRKYEILGIPPKPRVLKKWRWAYIAGLIDGEGTLSLRIDRRKQWIIYSPVIQIKMTDKKTISTISKWLKKAGFHPSDIKHAIKNYYYGVQLCRANEVLTFLETISPFLITKKPHAKILMDFCKARAQNFRKPYTSLEVNLVYKLRQLNSPKSSAKEVT